MSVGTVGNYWVTLFQKPAQNAATQEKKKTLVTNYVKGQAPDISLPRVATGGVAPFSLGRDIIKDPDIIWYGNLKPITVLSSKVDTVTDPDTGDETVTTTVTTTITGYTIDVQYCVGLGPGMRLRSILLDNAAVWTGTVGPARATFNVPNNAQIGDVIFAGGNFDQAVDVYLQSIIPQELPAYRGIAYVVLKALDTSKLGNISFEIDRYPDPLGLGAGNKIGDDINVASAIAEIITAKWGGAGQDIAKLGDSFTDLAALLVTEGNGCSITARNISSANDLNNILSAQIDATLWEDHETGKIEITPYRNGFDRTDLVRVFDRDIFKIDQMNKTSWQTVPTSLVVKYIDRAQNYAEIPLTVRNLATSDKVKKSTLEQSFPAVRIGGLAAKLLAREGASAGSPVQQITLTTNRKTAACNPGDIILITCEKYKYYSVPAIVVRRRTQPITDNSVTLLCNVILYPNNNVLFAAPEDSFFIPLDPNPHAPIAVKVLSAPWALRSRSVIIDPSVAYNYNWNVTTDQPLFYGVPYNPNQLTMRAYFHDVPTDTDIPIEAYSDSAPLDFVYQAAGKLTTAIDKYDNWDNASGTEAIVIHGIGGASNPMTNAMANFNVGNRIFILIGNEYFTVKKGGSGAFVYSAVLGTATLTGVRRGILDTVAEDHAVNDDVYIISGGDLASTAKRGFTFGASVDYVFTSMALPKNILTESNIAIALGVSYTGTDRANRPLRPHDTKINASRGTSSPTALALGATPTISWKVRGRSIVNSFTVEKDFPEQTDASQPGEVVASKHIVYRVWIEDSAAVEWDCGATADTADHSSLVATIPALAAPGDGWLWVNAEFDAGAGVKVSLYQDRLPITLS